MASIQLGASIQNKLDKSKRVVGKSKIWPGIQYDYWKFSKTSFLKGKQCEKYLYLDKHKRFERSYPDAKTKKLFQMGHSFEDLFRKSVFPNGINLRNIVRDWTIFNSYTKYLLNSNDKFTLFEATIIEEDVLIMVDVIDKKNNNNYDFYEIKLYDELNEVVWQDLTIQYYISKKRFGDKISTFNVVLRQNKEDWKIINLQSELEERIKNIDKTVKHFKTILTYKKEPKAKMSDKCDNPYKCEFKEYCTKLIELKVGK